jgi:hypothetical protein
MLGMFIGGVRMTTIIPLDKKINGYDPITQLVVRNDVKENIQGFLKELKDKLIYKYTCNCDDCIKNNIDELKFRYFGGLAE